MNNKIPGVCGLIGAPWMYIGFIVESMFPQLYDSWFTGLWGILYISGWTCLMVAVKRNELTGKTPFGNSAVQFLLVSLTLANISNVIQLVVGKNKPSWFFYLDLFWPLSNLLMLVIGIIIARANLLYGWKRFVPLAMGLWFPLVMLLSLIMGNAVLLSFGGMYSALSVTLLAIVIIGLGSRPGADTAVQPVIKGEGKVTIKHFSSQLITRVYMGQIMT